MALGVVVVVFGYQGYGDYNIKSTFNNLFAPNHNPATQSLDKELVCMINDNYMKKKQNLVRIDNKKYYGSCHTCIEDLVNKPEKRYSIDPFTGMKVDKALAFIAIDPATPDDRVLYFSSGKNYKSYLEKLTELEYENYRSAN